MLAVLGVGGGLPSSELQKARKALKQEEVKAIGWRGLRVVEIREIAQLDVFRYVIVLFCN